MALDADDTRVRFNSDPLWDEEGVAVNVADLERQNEEEKKDGDDEFLEAGDVWKEEVLGVLDDESKPVVCQLWPQDGDRVRFGT